MKKTAWSNFIIALFLTTTVACQAFNEEEDHNRNESAVEPAVTVTTDTAPQPETSEPAEPNAPTLLPPPLPTPDPTNAGGDVPLQVGGPAAGMQFVMPASWRDLSGRLDVRRGTNPLGLIVLLAADNERTGESLLAGKLLQEGAFITGHIAHLDLGSDNLPEALDNLVGELTPAISPLAAATAVSPNSLPNGATNGAFVDVLGDPLGFFDGESDNLRSRLYYFTPANNTTLASTAQAFFLFSTPEKNWSNFQPRFEEIADSIMLYDIEDGFTITDGDANVQRELGGQELVNGRLENSRKDVWTFRTDSGVYATVNLKPGNPALDLILEIIAPSGERVSRIDNGFAGDAEVTTDIFLSETGLYVVEISEFFSGTGPYSLSLVLTEDPLFTSGGRINFGQGVQSDLPANGQQVWSFNGSAGQLVSLVMTPLDDDLDIILAFFGPDGQQLITLDEGFSGDAEVINGYELPVTGEYAILARSFAGNSGEYALTLDEGGEETLNFYDAGDLLYGDEKQESLRANEAHAWFFNGRAGDQVRIVATPLSANLDPELWLLNAGVERLTTQDAFLEGEMETILYTLPADGQYLVLVRDFQGEAGVYEIELAATAVATPTLGGDLAYGDTINGNFSPDQVTVWEFSGEAGDRINITLSPATQNLDLILTVQNPDGEQQLTVDEGLVNEDEVVQDFVLDRDGRWRLLIREFFGEGGSYNITVDRVR